MKKVLLGMVLVSLMAGCSTAKKVDNASAAGATGAAETTTAAGATGAAATTGSAAAAATDAKGLTTGGVAQAGNTQAAGVAGAGVTDPSADPSLSKRSVYFAFDMDAIQDADRPTIQAHGAFLANNPGRKVRAEGNADERGSSEYNLALGQRRANSTKKALVLSGAKADQIETISYGEERPQAVGHDEAAWAQNRRTDIIYR